jgi:Tol biopolymer transport system component
MNKRIWRFGLAAAAAAAIVVIGIVLLTGNDSSAQLSPSSTRAATAQNTTPAPSPGVTQAQTDVGTLVVTHISNGRQDLYLVRSDGTGLRQLTASPGDEELAHWSPDGKRIVYNAWASNGSSVWVMNADGSGKLRLGAGETPSWSPDGKRIAYWGPSDSDGLSVMNADGSHRRSVGVPFYTNYERWAPNGKIVFVRVRKPELDNAGPGDLYEVNPDGSGLRRLTKGASLVQPYVSPDGSTIAAYATKTDRLIALPYRGDGPAVTLLAHASQYFPNGDWPVAHWAPDGKRLVLGGSNDPDATVEGAGLLLVNADGSGLTNVPGVTQVIYPDWRPK